VTWLFRQLQTINFLSKQLPFVGTFLCKHRAIKSFQQVCHICNSQTFNSVIKGHLKLLHVPLYYIILPAWRHFRKGRTNLHQFHKSCWVVGVFSSHTWKITVAKREWNTNISNDQVLGKLPGTGGDVATFFRTGSDPARDPLPPTPPLPSLAPDSVKFNLSESNENHTHTSQLYGH